MILQRVGERREDGKQGKSVSRVILDADTALFSHALR